MSTRSSSSFAEQVYANTCVSAQVRISVNTQRKTSARVLAASTRASVKQTLGLGLG